MAGTKQRPGRWYTWRGAVKDFIEFPSTKTNKDAKIDKAISYASAEIERFTNRRFYPVTATKTLDYQGAQQLVFGDDLLSITSIADNSVTLSESDYFLYPEDASDYNRPYLWLELLSTDALLVYDDTRQQAITIAGKWGYSELTSDSGDAVQNETQISASETSITVTAATNFDIGQTIMIGTEQIFVRNADTTTLTVTRGMNGTTAAIHASGTAINILWPPDDVMLACNILVARYMHRADTSWSDKIGSGEESITFSKSMPAEVIEILNGYKRLVHRPMRPVDHKSRAGRWSFGE